MLSIFQGLQTYVTPSWYASKQEHGKVVPTWNYAVVHAHGRLRFIRDAEWLMQFLHDLTDAQEQARPVPWQVSDAPDDFLKGQLNALVGFEIEITRMNGKWKMSQNKPEADQQSLIEDCVRMGRGRYRT